MSETRWRHSVDAAQVDSGERAVAVDLAADDPRPRVLEGVAAVIWRCWTSPAPSSSSSTRWSTPLRT